MTPEQKKLKNKHGDPEEFIEAIWEGYHDLFITETEAIAAIAKYQKEWDKAGKEGA